MACIQRFVLFSSAVRHSYAPTIASFHFGSLYCSAKYQAPPASPATLNVIHGNINELPTNVQMFILKRMQYRYYIMR